VFRLDEALKVYLHREPIDFRLNINGLALLVGKALGLHLSALLVYRLQKKAPLVPAMLHGDKIFSLPVTESKDRTTDRLWAVVLLVVSSSAVWALLNSVP
jgi:hypothetical protein